MDSTLEHYTYIGVGLVVAVAVLGMISAALAIRREAQIVLENRKFYAQEAKYKQQFESLEAQEMSAVDVISVIAQFADELDIYVLGTSDNSSQKLLINSNNRYVLSYIKLSDAEVKTGIGCTTVNNNYVKLAKTYGVVSAQSLGQLFYGRAVWEAQLVYDGKDVTTTAGINPDTKMSKITGIRFIRKA